MLSEPENQATQQDHATEYGAWLAERIGDLAKLKATGDDITAHDCASGLEPHHPSNRKMREFAIKELKIRAADFDHAVKARAVAARLGKYPHTSRELVDLVADEQKLTVRYNGSMERNMVPFVVIDGKKDFIPPQDWDTDDFRILVQTRFRGPLDYHQFRRKVRQIASDNNLPWGHADLNDACDEWFDEQKTDRLPRLVGEITYGDVSAKKGDADLLRVAETCFAIPEHMMDKDKQRFIAFIVACLKKFVWQTKRKMRRMPITDHLFVVWLGQSGSGKSTLLRRLLEPVAEVAIPADFRSIAEDRMITIWRNYVMYLDEMGWASKANIDVIKNLITAPTVLRRPMNTNSHEEIAQNATFIGCANAADLAELIRDFSGTRRFIGLHTKDKMDWDVVNSIDPLMIWKSVDEEAADPTAEFRDLLLPMQEAERPKTNVEVWVRQFDVKAVVIGNFDKARRIFDASELYDWFREYEDKCFPGDKTNVVWFARQLAQVPNCPFQKTPQHGRWQYTGHGPEGRDDNVTPFRRKWQE